MGAKGMIFRAWGTNECQLNLQWLVFRIIGGADFQLSDGFHGGLFSVNRGATCK